MYIKTLTIRRKVLKELPKTINKRISTISASREIFEKF